jgi:hypothetical protein
MEARRRWALVALLVFSSGVTLSVARRQPRGEALGQSVAPGFVELPVPPAPFPSPSITVETTSPPGPAPPPVSGAAAAPAARRPTVLRPTAVRPTTARPVGSPSAPVRIDVASIGASAAIDPLGLNRDGSLAVPKDFRRAGYYTGRSLPGEIGPAIIVAHVGSRSGPAVFARLSQIRPGAEVVVTRADKSRLVFIVDRLERHPKNAFPSEAVYGPTPDATLRLITCGGTFDQSTGHHRDNFIAFAHLRGPA